MPAGLPAARSWNHFTGYPVYHDVFFYNPDVRKFVVQLLRVCEKLETSLPTVSHLREVAASLDRRA